MQKGTLISFRPDIKVLDATIRDGGLVNNFAFTDEFVKELYETNIKAGIDYMEFGYKASKEIFPVDQYGKWKYCDEDNLRAIVGDNDSNMKIAVMADVGRTDFRQDIIDKSDSVIDMIRVATYINKIPSAVDMAEYCKNKGYETTINIMAISHANDSDLAQALEILGQSGVADVIYLVDSYGSLYPEQIRKLSELYLEFADKYNVKIGIHAHNNQQLAFANTIEATAMGVSYLDATINSLGRGAGNCPMELLLGFLKNPKYHLTPILRFIENNILNLKTDDVKWGYDIQYLLTGLLNQHPSSAIEFTHADRKDYAKFYHEILDKE